MDKKAKDHKSDQKNPNNEKHQKANDNKSDQKNPNNDKHASKAGGAKKH